MSLGTGSHGAVAANDDVRPTPLVVRSIVQEGLPYSSYRQSLRRDFIYSCGYCSLSEYEAQGLSFQIDHYEPQSARPDLEDTYVNLMYACDECNRLKTDLTPPPDAFANGYRFYRPDADIWDEHFTASGHRIDPTSNVGEFSVEALDLNRQSLRRLRDIRTRLSDCSEQIAKGVLGLRRFKLDQLPVSIRGRALQAINRVANGADEMANNVDAVLEAAAQSPLLDPDPEKAERRADWQKNFRAVQGLYPGVWRGRQAKG